jgi:hypothetical protein
MKLTIERLIEKECEARACWKDLSEIEQDEVRDGYQKIYDAGVQSQTSKIEEYSEALCAEQAECVRLHTALEKVVEGQDGDVCPACATEFENGTFNGCGGSIVKEAADLRAENAMMKVALEPFAKACNLAILRAPEGCGIYSYDDSVHPKNNIRLMATDLVVARVAFIASHIDALAAIRDAQFALSEGDQYNKIDALKKLNKLFGARK